MAHAAQFDRLVARVQRTLSEKPWRTGLRHAPEYTVAVLEGVEAALRTPAVVNAVRLIYPEFFTVRMACSSMHRVFTRVMDSVRSQENSE